MFFMVLGHFTCLYRSRVIGCLKRLLSPEPVSSVSYGAGIAVVITCCGCCDARLVMIEKRRWEGYPWSGDMAFPGGMRRKGEGITETIFRELEEETCIREKDVVALGFLEAEWPKNMPQLLVAPLILLHRNTCEKVSRKPCSSEVERIALVPLPSRIMRTQFLHPVRETILWGHKDWYGNTIWGMSLRVLEKLVRVLSTCLKL